MFIRECIERVRDEIDKADHAYFVMSDPIMSDDEYDKRVSYLERMEIEYPEFAGEQKIGSDLTPGIKKRKHRVPMLSIRKIYTYEELDKWFNDVKRELQTTQLIASKDQR